MLIVLFVSMIFLFLISFFLFKKNFLSPSIILCLTLLIGTLFSLIGNAFFWKENVSAMGPSLIIAGTGLFVVGEFVVDKIIQKKHTPNYSDKAIVFYKKNLVICIFAFIFGVIIDILLFKCEYQMAKDAGMINMNYFMIIVRNLFHEGINPPIYLSLAGFMVEGFGFASIIMASKQFFGGDKKRYSLIYLILLLPLFVKQFLSTSRNGFVLDFIVIIASIYHYGFQVYKRITKKEMIIFTLSIIVAFAMVFLFAGLYTGKTGGSTNIIESICIYTGSPIVAMDKAINSVNFFEPGGFQNSYSFVGIIQTLKKIFPTIPSSSRFLKFMYFTNGNGTNIYSGFCLLYLDFGFFGCCLLMLALGAFSAFIKAFFSRTRVSSMKFIYFYYLYNIFYILFTSPFHGFLSVTEVFEILCTSIALFLFIHLTTILSLFKAHKIVSNILFAFIAQGVSLILSLMMSFFVPKVLGVLEYSYWQLFIFYTGYVGIFHLGYIDGVYLKMGGKKENDINKNETTSQFIIFAISQFVLSACTCLIWCPLVASEGKRIFVIIFSAIYLIFSNLGLFFGYIFQAINKTKTYSIALFCEKAFFLVVVILFFALKIDDSRLFIVFYCSSRILFFLFLLICSFKLTWGKPIFKKTTVYNMISSISRGFNLMLASLASMFIIGIARLIIDSNWGIEAFGRFSFSISLCSFAIAFLTQISMVFFPALRQKNDSFRQAAYIKMRKVLAIILPLAYFSYFILKIIVNNWISNYASSIAYFGLLLPICVYDGKTQMLFNTYLKVLNKERKLLIINLIAFSVSAIFGLLSALVFHNMYGVIISSVVAIVIRSLVSDIYVSKLMNYKDYLSIIVELIVTVTFTILTFFVADVITFAVLFVMYLIVLAINRKTIIGFAKTTYDFFKRHSVT